MVKNRDTFITRFAKLTRSMDEDIPYLLLTPGPLTTSRTVRAAMQQDWCTWDADYYAMVDDIRRRLVGLASRESEQFTAVLMQGSGTFSVEAAVGSLVPPEGKILVINNGAYGARIVQIARRLHIAWVELAQMETEPADVDQIIRTLASDPAITHVVIVHCETTTGMLNPVAEIGKAVRQHGRTFIVDAMSSFGGIPFMAEDIGADCLISSANKCIQGVPGFGFVIVKRALLERSEGWARSYSLDLYDQWRTMEEQGGKWRFTSPTHTMRAFAQALDELEQEGGIPARYQRYCANQRMLVVGMEKIGFRTLLPRHLQSPIITAFVYPPRNFVFERFYAALKSRRFVIYPGKLSHAATFRIGTIGHVFPADIAQLLDDIAIVIREQNIQFD